MERAGAGEGVTKGYRNDPSSRALLCRFQSALIQVCRGRLEYNRCKNTPQNRCAHLRAWTGCDMSYRAFKRLLGETSLERKCRFLFGIGVFVLIWLSFWFYAYQTEHL